MARTKMETRWVSVSEMTGTPEESLIEEYSLFRDGVKPSLVDLALGDENSKVQFVNIIDESNSEITDLAKQILDKGYEGRKFKVKKLMFGGYKMMEEEGYKFILASLYNSCRANIPARLPVDLVK